jgi:hypothetical protein
VRFTRALSGLLLACLLLILRPASLFAAGGTYTAKPGDTLAKIAAANGTTAQALMGAYGLKNPDLNYPGQKLAISRASSAPAGPAAGQAGSPAKTPVAYSWDNHATNASGVTLRCSDSRCAHRRQPEPTRLRHLLDVSSDNLNCQSRGVANARSRYD